MLNKLNISSGKHKFIIYVVLILATLAVYWQVNRFDFVNFDDVVYITDNINIKSGISLEGIRWAFGTRHFDLWHPLIWISFMFDYQFHGLNPAGYHLTNLILHLLSTLLLFWLFCRMTGMVWKSAFVAALFALHPLHVESVAWIAERKDVLSAFFWMLTLCFYVYYTEKPGAKRYLPVMFAFVLALLSKPMVVTLPLIMILLDYWPLNRFESKKDNLILWQLKEKLPFFILSAVLVIITLHTPATNAAAAEKSLPLISRLANAPLALIAYLGKTFWPYDLAVFYPFPGKLPLWQVLGAASLIVMMTVFVIAMKKRLPYLFAGWLWYAITILPVLGIIQIGDFAMADRYHYVTSIGISIMIAWGIPSLIRNESMLKKIFFPAGMTIIAILAVLTWQQCGYWKNSYTLFSHALRVTNNNYLAHNNLATALTEEGRVKEAIDHYNEVIRARPDSVQAYKNRGNTYAALGLREQANDKMRQKSSSRTENINNPGLYRQAIEDLNNAILLSPDSASYNNRGIAYSKIGQYKNAIEDFNKAIALNSNYYTGYNNRGLAYANLGQYEHAIEDYSEAVRLKPDYVKAYNNRASAYFIQGKNRQGCIDVNKACSLGECGVLEAVRGKGYCR